MLTRRDVDDFCDAYDKACKLLYKIQGFKSPEDVCLVPMSKFLEVNKLCDVPIQSEMLITKKCLFFIYKGIKFYKTEEE